MDVKRTARHLFYFRSFPEAARGSIEKAVAESEAQHGGQVCVAVETALEVAALFAGQTARERAIEVFSLLGVWDTEENNGVLIYLLLADHDLEIVADRGINAKVAPGEWQRICQVMEALLARGALEQAIVEGIRQVSQHLATHYPYAPDGGNELPDRLVVL